MRCVEMHIVDELGIVFGIVDVSMEICCVLVFAEL